MGRQNDSKRGRENDSKRERGREMIARERQEKKDC